MSSRNVSPRTPATGRRTRRADHAPVETRDRILDAAAHYGAVMHRQPAIAELARRAGVSRPTVYRYFADGDALFRALWEREIGNLLDANPFGGDDLGELVDRVVDLADLISTHEVLAPTFATDASTVARYIVDRFGTSQRLVFDRLRTAIERVQAAGGARDGKPDELTAMVMLIVQSAVQSRAMIAEFLDDDAWRRELAHALTGYLRP